VALAEMIAALGTRVEESSDVMNMRSAFSALSDGTTNFWNNLWNNQQPLPTTSSVDRPQGLLGFQYGGGSGEDR